MVLEEVSAECICNHVLNTRKTGCCASNLVSYAPVPKSDSFGVKGGVFCSTLAVDIKHAWNIVPHDLCVCLWLAVGIGDRHIWLLWAPGDCFVALSLVWWSRCAPHPSREASIIMTTIGEGCMNGTPVHMLWRFFHQLRDYFTKIDVERSIRWLMGE